MPQRQLILGSTSQFRKQQLAKFGIPFTQIKPLCNEDEIKLDLEKKSFSPFQLAESLSLAKGLSIREHLLNIQQKDFCIISGDQLVEFNNISIGKSHTFDNALKTLSQLRSHQHRLITVIHLLTDTHIDSHVNITQLTMHHLSDSELANYIKKDETTDCAGSYKIELSGITLFSKIETTDFSAIQGLPLLWLGQKLKELNYEFYTQF